MKVAAKVFLQGALTGISGQVMRTDLNAQGLLPLAQPYNGYPFSNPLNAGYAGAESVTTAFFAANPGIVDWVLVELRDSVNPSSVVATRAAFLRSDGILIGIDGQPYVGFPGVAAGSYYIGITHRNHLSVASAAPQALSTALPATYDFTTGIGQSMDNGSGNAMAQVHGIWTMWAGDVWHDQILDGVDFNFVTLEVLNGYFGEYHFGDVNLDGICDSLDRSLAKLNFFYSVYSPFF